MIETLDHVGFTVSDLDRSVSFYRDLLGLELVWVRVYEEEYVRTAVGYPTARLRCAYLKLPRCQVHLELLEYQGVPRDNVEQRRANPGNAHLALAVSDIDAMYRRLKEAGVDFVSPPVTSTAGYYQGSKTVYFHDPDGISIQFMELHRGQDA